MGATAPLFSWHAFGASQAQSCHLTHCSTCTSFRFLPPAFCSFNTSFSATVSTGTSAPFATLLSALMVVIECVTRQVNVPGTAFADALAAFVDLAMVANDVVPQRCESD